MAPHHALGGTGLLEAGDSKCGDRLWLVRQSIATATAAWPTAQDLILQDLAHLIGRLPRRAAEPPATLARELPCT